MNELVIMKEQQAVTTSLMIAEVFGKNHRDVLKAIDELKEGVAQNFADLFHESSYIHDQNKQSYRMYLMNRDGFSLLVMGFTGKEAMKFKLQYIDAFNRMEKQLTVQAPTTMVEALEMALISAKENELLKIENQEMKPKALFADSVASSHTSILVGDLAKILKQNGIDIGQNRLFEELRQDGFLIRRKGASYNTPTQRSMEMDLFEIIERTHNNPDGSTRITKTTKVTGKGQIYFINRYLKEKGEL